MTAETSIQRQRRVLLRIVDDDSATPTEQMVATQALRILDEDTYNDQAKLELVDKLLRDTLGTENTE